MQWMQNSSKYKPLLVTILLVIGCIAIFHPVIQYDFINYDDNIYVTSNTHVRDGLSWRGLQWAFGALEAGFWHPLTWLSLMIDHTLYGLNAGGYHWTNLLFHIASTVLLFLSLYRMSGALWRSGLVAALFACHPINVEPVAWIASRKDVLSTFFWMMTLLLYNQYAVKGGIIRYILVVLGFMMGLMSKPITATLPFVFLLLDYWPLGRWEKNIYTPAVYRETAAHGLGIHHHRHHFRCGKEDGCSCLSGNLPSRRAYLQCRSFLYRLYRKNVLAHRSGCLLSPSRLLAALEGYIFRIPFAGHHTDRSQVFPAFPLSACWLVLVCGNAGPCNRNRSDWVTCHGGSLCLHTIHWSVHHHQLGDCGFRPAIVADSPSCGPGCCCGNYRVRKRSISTGQALAKQHYAF